MGGCAQTSYNYKDGFQKFKSYIENIHNQTIENQIYEGYLVYYKDYLELEKNVGNFYKEKQQKNKYNPYQFEFIESKKLKTESIESVLNQISNDQKFIIINDDIYKLICERFHPQEKIEYIINKECLFLNRGNGNGIQFKNTKDNIIEKFNYICNINYMNSLISKSYFFENMKHLIRYPYFKQEIISTYNAEQNYLKDAYLINKNIINRFKQLYNLRNLMDNLYNQKLLEGVTYQNCDDNYGKIYEYLNRYQINYINNILQNIQLGKGEFNRNEKIYSAKTINNQPNLIYVDNFEIIDQEYYSFLSNKFCKGISGLKITLANVEGKILLLIDYGETYIYEIIRYSQNGDIIVEYLIEIIKLSNDAVVNDKSIFQFIQKLMSGRKPISVDENVGLKFHPINNYLKQNINPNKNEMSQIKGSIINNNKNNNDYFELQINALKNQ